MCTRIFRGEKTGNSQAFFDKETQLLSGVPLLGSGLWTRGQLAISLSVCWASQVVLVVKRKQKKPRLPMQETQETRFYP